MAVNLRRCAEIGGYEAKSPSARSEVAARAADERARGAARRYRPAMASHSHIGEGDAATVRSTRARRRARVCSILLLVASCLAAIPQAAMAANEPPGATRPIVESLGVESLGPPLPAHGADLTAAAEAPRLPVGAFCPTRPADPARETSAFGLTALLMWGLARRRTRTRSG